MEVAGGRCRDPRRPPRPPPELQWQYLNRRLGVGSRPRGQYAGEARQESAEGGGRGQRQGQGFKSSKFKPRGSIFEGTMQCLPHCPYTKPSAKLTLSTFAIPLRLLACLLRAASELHAPVQAQKICMHDRIGAVRHPEEARCTACSDFTSRRAFLIEPVL